MAKGVRGANFRKNVVGRARFTGRTYFYWSHRRQAKMSPYFDSRKAARKWFERKWWRFIEFPIMDDYLADSRDKGIRNPQIRARLWNEAKDATIDFILSVGHVEYLGKYFDDLYNEYYQIDEEEKPLLDLLGDEI